MTRTLIVEEFKVLDDGLHQGVIKGIEWREQPYPYMDLVIESKEVTIKAGFPQQLNPTNKTGLMMKRFGIDLSIGNNIDPEKVLIGKKCKFVTVKKTTPKGVFSNVLTESICPI